MFNHWNCSLNLKNRSSLKIYMSNYACHKMGVNVCLNQHEQ